ncbi:type II toxin-antitoxin system CcdA family antitoxin [Microvirga terrae]|uniref:Type II toxin-antitoxin system CcdA family antitoxin n=1 Tax=Microvirga terrae TaxID=2740529 RepID=A0ABY5RVW6_9HYPH|nr:MULTISPECIES: type II toxin-antitoxin system CcdA family antitoxin [Microvirga]MBQ0821562.1 type II toxin-antitoxin system CcdA family antitoxin [Microvirga sp. HBU67558]UVF19927.1 type II toxin-antitoxin system CcdA family antitoxin [Microvirga terrae]
MSKPLGAARDRRPTNVTLPVELVAEAKALNINVSQACESGLARSVAQARQARWLADNRDAIEAYNRMVERDELPLDQFRQF